MVFFIARNIKTRAGKVFTHSVTQLADNFDFYKQFACKRIEISRIILLLLLKVPTCQI